MSAWTRRPAFFDGAGPGPQRIYSTSDSARAAVTQAPRLVFATAYAYAATGTHSG